MPATSPRRWTAEDVRALPDEPNQRFECVDGALLVSPTPRLTHQSIVMLLATRIEAYVRERAIGAAFISPSDLELDAYTLVQPDVYVLPLVDGRRPRTQAEIGQPLLFVEVLSPSTARYDRVIKRARYQRAGIEYWIVDLDARLLERWMPDAHRPSIHPETVVWEPVSSVPALTIALTPLFVDALGDE